MVKAENTYKMEFRLFLITVKCNCLKHGGGKQFLKRPDSLDLQTIEYCNYSTLFL